MKPVPTALFAPGSGDRVIAKAMESGADAVILDLEDSVPVASKGTAVDGKLVDYAMYQRGKRVLELAKLDA